MISRSFETTLNALALLAISAVLGVAFLDQFANGELPCPLCLLQRAGFLLLAIGPVLNVARGPRPAHYGVTILAGLLGAGFAMRQVLLHIEPGDAARLGAMAHRTYAPDTEASRLAGAGAGLTDND